MAKQTPDEYDVSPGETELQRLYRDSARELPPPALDARILAAARDAVETPPAHRRVLRRWTVPLSVAAVVMLSVGVVLRLTHEGAFEDPTSFSTAPAIPAPPSEPAVREEAAPPVPASPARQAPAAKTKRERAEAKRDMRSLRDAETAGDVAPQSAPARVERRARDDAGSAGLAASQAFKALPNRADVIAVRVGGRPGAYEFEVEIKSPDTGCRQYADWWEVVGTDGELIYRRVLAHSHADEQPFARSGGPVPIAADTIVWVRAHMNATGYGGAVLKGSPAGGFVRVELAPDFAADLARRPPLPAGCAF